MKIDKETIVTGNTYFRNYTGFSVDIDGEEFNGDYVETGEAWSNDFDQSIEWEEDEPDLDEDEEQELMDELSSKLQK